MRTGSPGVARALNNSAAAPTMTVSVRQRRARRAVLEPGEAVERSIAPPPHND